MVEKFLFEICLRSIVIMAPAEIEMKNYLEAWDTYKEGEKTIVTDMYMPNPKRLRDWLSVPKSNGYESLHTTVMGPGVFWFLPSKW